MDIFYTLYHYHHVHCIIFTMYILRTTRQGMYLWRIVATLLYNHCCSEKTRNITYFECVSLALGIQQTISMRYIAIYGLSGPTTFFTLSHKRHDFWQKKCYRKQKVHFPFSRTFLILRRMERYMIKNVYCSSCKVPVVLVILIKLELSLQIFEKHSNIKFHKNPSMGAELSHADRQKDREAWWS
jgi:hypothetical protein